MRHPERIDETPAEMFSRIWHDIAAEDRLLLVLCDIAVSLRRISAAVQIPDLEGEKSYVEVNVPGVGSG